MTYTDIQPGYESDEIVARVALGWKHDTDDDGNWFGWLRPDGALVVDLPRFTSSADEALALMPKLSGGGGLITLTYLPEGVAVDRTYGVYGYTRLAVAETLPLAVCRAVLWEVARNGEA